MSDSKDLLVAPTQLLSNETILALPPERLSDKDLVTVWSILDLFEKALIKERKSDLKEEMFLRASKLGKKTDKGSFDWELPDGKITKQRKETKAQIEPELVKEKLSGLSDVLFDATITLPLGLFKLLKESFDKVNKDGHKHEQICAALNNPQVSVSTTRFEGLVAAGIISEKVAETVCTKPDPTWALIVKKPKTLKPIEDKIKDGLRKYKELADE